MNERRGEKNMHPTIYGIDVKIDKDGQPWIIEVNGANFGTDFFKYPEGERYYDRIVKILGRYAQGRTIFIESDDAEAPQDREEQSKKINALEARLQNISRVLRKATGKFGLDFDDRWIKDVIDFKTHQIGMEPDNESQYYTRAARKLGIGIKEYSEVEYNSDGTYTFTLPDNRKLTMHKRDIGLIWAGEDDITQFPEQDDNVYLNSPFLELILGNKALFHIALIGENGDLPRPLAFLPRHMFYGFGIASIAEIAKFAQEYRDERLLLKRAGSSCGTGVEVVTREELPTRLLDYGLGETRRTRAPSREYLEAFGVMAAGLKLGENLRFEDFVTIIQKFVESKPVIHPVTGRPHDSCIRAVVLRPDGRHKPIYIDGQHRLSPEPMDSTSADLNQKFRANLSRGARAVPLGTEDEAIVKPFVERFVLSLEEKVHKAEKEVRNRYNYYKRESALFQHEQTHVDLFRQIFWDSYMTKVIEMLGNNGHDDQKPIRNPFNVGLYLLKNFFKA